MMYGYKIELDMKFKDAIDKVTEELQKEGFGVITEIDIKDKFKEKLNIEYKDYIILGACSPSYAHKALQLEKDIGLLLPCNVVVYKDKNKVYVSAILPTIAMVMVDNKEVTKIANEIENKLKKVIDRLKEVKNG